MLVLGLLFGRIAWQLQPTLWACIAFWSMSSFIHWIDWNGRSKRPKWIQAMAWGGALSNALVTISNGGKMPCLTNSGTFLSVWVKATPAHHFLWLCDRFPGGFSIGDLLLLSALIAGLVWALIPSKKLTAEGCQ